MSLTLPVKITYHKAKYYTEGRTEPVRAIVNHRMVGYVAGTRAYFANPSRPVSTHFGIGIINGKLVIDQYVPLDDTAYGNGNYDPTGLWDDWGFKTTEVNAQTISIEHQDHGDPKGKGVVSESIQQASIALQALLLRGRIIDWRDAGIVLRDYDKNGPILKAELRKVPIDRQHIIDHHNIAGKLKPSCWRPWEKDTIGFPKAKYIAGIENLVDPPVEVPPVVTPPPVVVPPTPELPFIYTQAQVDTIVAAAKAEKDKVILDLNTALTACNEKNNTLKKNIIAYIEGL